MPKSDDYHLTRSLGFLLADCSRLMRKRFDARARELGLTRAQWRVLGQLRRREGINQTALAEILEIETITLGRHIDRLADKGWVERRADPADRRAWRLHLTKEVRPVLDRLKELSEANRDEALAGISEDEREGLIDALLAIKANLREREDKPAQAPARKAEGCRNG